MNGECTGKIPFPTPQAAIAKADCSRERAWSNDGYDLRVYRCPICGQWHFGGGNPKPFDYRRDLQKKTWKNWHWRKSAADD